MTPEQWMAWFAETFPLGAKANVVMPGDDLGDEDMLYEEMTALPAFMHPFDTSRTTLAVFGNRHMRDMVMFPTGDPEHDPEDGTYLVSGTNEGIALLLMAPVRKQEAQVLGRMKSTADRPQNTVAYYKAIYR